MNFMGHDIEHNNSMQNCASMADSDEFSYFSCVFSVVKLNYQDGDDHQRHENDVMYRHADADCWTRIRKLLYVLATLKFDMHK